MVRSALAPERRVEPLAQRRRLSLQALRERGVAPDGARQLGGSQLRVVDVALHLGRRDRSARDRPVMEELRVVRVLPGLVLDPAVVSPFELDEAVAVAVGALDPVERPDRVAAKLVDQGVVAGPAPVLGEQNEEERRRVDGSVVAAEPAFRRLAAPQLVHDLAGLGVDGGIVFDGLERGEAAQPGARELRAQRQRLEARDQGVAAEDRHEPRQAGRDQLSARAEGHPQGGDIDNRLTVAPLELRPARLERRETGAPPRQRAGDASALRRDRRSRLLWRADPETGGRNDLQHERPARAGCKAHVVADARLTHLAGLREHDLRLRTQLRF